MRLLLTRPSDDSALLAEKLSKHDLSSLVEPMLDIVYPSVNTPDLNGVQGILVTSANGIRALARICPQRDLGIWAVGPASAAEARRLGYDHVHHGDGDVAALAALVREHLVPAGGALLHVAGTRLAGDLAGMLGDAGYEYRRAVLYEAQTATELSATAQGEIKSGLVSGAVFFSPRTAETFTRLIVSAGLSDACAQMTAFCLSAAVAEKVSRLGWGDVVVAEQPHEKSLITSVLRVAKSA
jgi:uroporphyrinogen-III synthase